MFFAGCTQSNTETTTGNTPEIVTPEAPANPEAPVVEPEKPVVEPEIPVVPVEEVRPYYVKNSLWQDVDLMVFASRAAAEPSLDQALIMVDNYNLNHNDDQLFLNTVDIPVEEAPDVTIFIVNEGDYVEFARYVIPREEFAEKRYVYEMDAAGFGGLLFVDKVPPVPVIPPDLRTREEKYSIYMVNKYDKIVEYNGFRYEKHIDQIWDALDEGTKAGYTNGIDDLMDWYVKAFKTDECLMVADDAPWRVVSGQIYVEPPDHVE